MSVRKRKTLERNLNRELSNAVGKYDTLNTEALLAEGANPNSSYDLPAIFYASIPNLQLLLDQGANIDQQDENGQTLLSELCTWYNPNQPGGEDELEKIRFLLEKGADPNLADKEGITPLHYVCMKSLDPVIIRILIENGADVNQIDNMNDTPLHKLGKHRGTRVYPLSRVEEVIRTLLGARANPLLKNNDGHTASELAEAYELPLPLIRILKQAERNAGANVNVPDLPEPRNANAVGANNREQLRNQILAMGNAQNEFNEIPGMNQAEFEHILANPLRNNENMPVANHIPHNAGNVNIRNAAPAAGGRRKSRKGKKAQKTRKGRKGRKGHKGHKARKTRRH